MTDDPNVEPDVDEPIEDTIATPEDDPDDEKPAYVPPSQGKWTRVSNALAKAKDRVTELEQQLAAKADKPDDEEVKREQAIRAREEKLARSEATSALLSAGLNADRKGAALIARVIASGAEPDDAGEYDFEDAIEELREQIPALFGKSTNGRQLPPRVGTADRGGREPVVDPDAQASRTALKRAGLRR